MLGRFLVGWLVLCLVKSPGMKCTDMAKSLTQLLANYKDTKSLPRDIYFGLNLAYKILSGTHHQANERDRNEFYWKTLEYVKVLKSGEMLQTRNISVYSEIILESISDNSEVWWRTIKHRLLDVAMINETFLDYEWVVDKGLPRKNDSDQCMAQIGSTKSCVISSKCVRMMMSRTPSYGYHKTHQFGFWKITHKMSLTAIIVGVTRNIWPNTFMGPRPSFSQPFVLVLFLLLIILKRCSNYLPIDQSIDFIISEKCSDIYKEHTILLKWGVPDDYRDLFMEQSLFCGIAGYSEFLASTIVKSIPLWQSDDGCFYTGSNNVEYLESHCMDHINSLGVAFYSNLIAIQYLH